MDLSRWSCRRLKPHEGFRKSNVTFVTFLPRKNPDLAKITRLRDRACSLFLDEAAELCNLSAEYRVAVEPQLISHFNGQTEPAFSLFKVSA